jgi:hypothetical protein
MYSPGRSHRGRFGAMHFGLSEAMRFGSEEPDKARSNSLCCWVQVPALGFRRLGSNRAGQRDRARYRRTANTRGDDSPRNKCYATWSGANSAPIRRRKRHRVACWTYAPLRSSPRLCFRRSLHRRSHRQRSQRQLLHLPLHRRTRRLPLQPSIPPEPYKKP